MTVGNTVSAKEVYPRIETAMHVMKTNILFFSGCLYFYLYTPPRDYTKLVKLPVIKIECEIPQKGNLCSLRNRHLFPDDLFSTLIFVLPY